MLTEQLLEAKLIKRYKRFLADVQIAGSPSTITVHCPNPGSMFGIADEGAKIWLRKARNPKAKLSHTWVLTELESTFVNVDTLMANKLMYEVLHDKRIDELRGYKIIKKEQTFLESRFDFFLAEHTKLPDCFMEVKSTTLADGAIAMFPDAKTERGKKHLEHLIECNKQGHRAVQFFCVCRSDTNTFSPADHIDAVYGKTLRLAANNGVEMLAYSVNVLQNGNDFSFDIGKPVTIDLN